PRRRGRVAVGRRGVFRDCQGRLRVGPLRGAVVGRVAPAGPPELVRLGGRGRDPVPGRRGEEKKAAGLIRLSVPEVRKLLLKVVWSHVPPVKRTLAWSVWRRRHQHRARISHYRKRRAKPPKD